MLGTSKNMETALASHPPNSNLDVGPLREPGEGVGSAPGIGEYADGLVDLGVVARQARCDPARLVEAGEGTLLVPVQQPCAGDVDPVMSGAGRGDRCR